MRYALIGCGRIAPNHLAAVKDNHLELVAVCDLLPEKMEELLIAQNLDGDPSIKRYTDYKKMLAENDIQLAAIATISGVHAEIALYCIDRGVNLIIEKPIAMSMADANAIVKRSADKGVAVSVCHQNRFNLAVQQTRAALDSGRFGLISHGSVSVRWYRDADYYSSADWRGTWKLDGGCLMNQCIHGIDLLLWLLGGEIDEVFGATRRRLHDYIEAEDVGLAMLKFKNGAIATIEGTTNTYKTDLEETIYIIGERGTVKIGGASATEIDVWDFADKNELDGQVRSLCEDTSNIYGNGHSRVYADMIDAVNTGRHPYITASDGRKALEVILAIYKSQKTGLPVKLPLENFATLDMTGEF